MGCKVKFWLIHSTDKPVFGFSAFDNQSKSSDSTLRPQTVEISKYNLQSMGGGVDSKIRLPDSQIVFCNHPEPKNPEILRTLSTHKKSLARSSSNRPDKISREGSEEQRHDDGRDHADRENHEPAAEVPVSAPSIRQTRAYPTSGSNFPSTPGPSGKRTKRFAVETHDQNFLPSLSRTPTSDSHLANRASNPRAIQNSANTSYLEIGAFFDFIKSVSADYDGFKDMDICSIRDRMISILETIETFGPNLEDSAMKIDQWSESAHCPRQSVPHRAAPPPRTASIPSATSKLRESMSVLSSEDVEKRDDNHTNSLKRRYSIAFTEVYKSSTPSTLDHAPQTFPVAHAEWPTSHSGEINEYEKEMRMQSPLLQPALELASPPSTQLAESLDGLGSPEPRDIWKAFPEVTSHQRSHIERTVNCLFRDDLTKVLEKHSGTWNTSGFWNGPVGNTAASSKFPSGPNQTGPTAYLLGLRNDSETYDLELRVARVHLFLLLQREIIRECRRGTPKKTAKSNAISNLCNSKGLGLAEKTKLHQLFLSEKRIGGYWWWCVSFFGPSFLLRCSTKAGKSMSVKFFFALLFFAIRLTEKRTQHRFPLDAMIAYVLHEYPQTVKPHALDAAVIHLLMTGSFPNKFLQQGGDAQVHCAHVELAVTPMWRFFSTEAAEDEAISCLHRWSINPENRLLTI